MSFKTLQRRNIAYEMDIPERRTYPPEAVGLEIEIEARDGRQIDLPDRMDVWTVKGDGSLRNGVELCNLPEADIDDVYEELEEILESNEDVLETSIRCSVHVHLNYQHHYPMQVLSFMVAYTALESVLNSFSGKRDRNLYCLGMAHAYMDNRRILNGIYTSLLNNRHAAECFPHSEGLKYAAVNFQRLFDLGTLEIRTMEGTLDVNRIKTWVDMLQAVKQWSSKFDSAAEILDYFQSTPPKKALSEILGDLTGELKLSDIYEDEIRKGYYRAASFIVNYDNANMALYQVAKKKKLKLKKKKAAYSLGDLLDEGRQIRADDMPLGYRLFEDYVEHDEERNRTTCYVPVEDLLNVLLEPSPEDGWSDWLNEAGLPGITAFSYYVHLDPDLRALSIAMHLGLNGTRGLLADQVRYARNVIEEQIGINLDDLTRAFSGLFRYFVMTRDVNHLLARRL